MAKNGVMIQDDKGDLYFLRPEILSAAKLPKALHKDAKVALAAAKKTPAPKLKVLGALRIVKVDVSPEQTRATPELSAKATKGAAVRSARRPRPRPSTIMCPW